MHRIWSVIQNYSLLLISGTLIALIWANADAASYHALVDLVIWDNAPVGHRILTTPGCWNTGH